MVAQEPLHRAALERLARIYPSAVQISALAAELGAEVGGLIELFSACYLRGFVELDVSDRGIPAETPERPRAVGLVRAQLAAGAEEPLTSALHQGIGIRSAAHRAALALADGDHTVEMIAEAVGAGVEETRGLLEHLRRLGLIVRR